MDLQYCFTVNDPPYSKIIAYQESLNPFNLKLYNNNYSLTYSIYFWPQFFPENIWVKTTALIVLQHIFTPKYFVRQIDATEELCNI